MRSDALRQRAFIDGWWTWWPRFTATPRPEPAARRRAPPPPAPLPEQDPGLPLYHDAHLW